MPSDLQRDVARVLLGALGAYDFALSGGYALSEHELTNRPTRDIDLFTNTYDAALFRRAVDEAVAVLKQSGFQVHLEKKFDTFARINIDSEQELLSIDLGYDYREDDTVLLDIGPVLDKRDAILNKVSALYSRMLARDFIDAYNARESQYLSDSEILELSKERDDGFVLEYFAQALRKIQIIAFDDFVEYGITKDSYDKIRAATLLWADEIEAAIQ
jgi:hypothetical protein